MSKTLRGTSYLSTSKLKNPKTLFFCSSFKFKMSFAYVLNSNLLHACDDVLKKNGELGGIERFLFRQSPSYADVPSIVFKPLLNWVHEMCRIPKSNQVDVDKEMYYCQVNQCMNILFDRMKKIHFFEKCKEYPILILRLSRTSCITNYTVHENI